MVSIKKILLPTLLITSLFLTAIPAFAAEANPDDAKIISSINLETQQETYSNIKKNRFGETSTPSYNGSGVVDFSLEADDFLMKPTIGIDEKNSKGILGSDNRTRVTGTTEFPYSAIVSLNMTCQKGHNYVGSGFMIGRSTVATAGHCVHDIDCGGWMKRIAVTPGRNGSSTPYGTTTAKTLNSVKGWTQSQNRSYDYAVIELNSPIGDRTGWFGLSGNNGSINGKSVTISGYPSEKSYQQWKHSGIISSGSSTRIQYPIDTTGGQSGAPVYWYNSTYGYQAAGIHTAAYSSSLNNGTKINIDVFNFLTSF